MTKRTTPKKKETPRRGRPPGWCGRADATYWHQNGPAGTPVRWKCAECRMEFSQNPTLPVAPLDLRRFHYAACRQYPAAEVAAQQEADLRIHRMVHSLADLLRPAESAATRAIASWVGEYDPVAALRVARETHAALGAWLKTWDVEPADKKEINHGQA